MTQSKRTENLLTASHESEKDDDGDSNKSMDKQHSEEESERDSEEDSEHDELSDSDDSEKDVANDESEEEDYSECQYERNEDEDAITFDYNDGIEFTYVDDDHYGHYREEDEPDDSEFPTPDWFAHEDPDQIRVIFQLYSKALDLDEERKRCIREPPKFIGRIKRNKVMSETKFQTYDMIDIYRRSTIAPGTLMPLVKTIHTLTSWSFEEGLPTEIAKLSNSEKKHWHTKLEPSEPTSYLLCEPVFGTHCEYDYCVSEEDRKLRHSPLSYQHHCFDDFIPENHFSDSLHDSPTDSTLKID